MPNVAGRSITFVPLATTILAANRFVTPETLTGSIGYPTAGGSAGYLTLDASPLGSVAALACAILDGALLEVETGGAIPNGAAVAADVQGRAIVADPAVDYVLGIAQQTSSALGEVITIATPSLFGGAGAHPDEITPIVGLLGINRFVVRLAAGYGLTAATPFGATHVTLEESPAASQAPIRAARLNGAPVQVIAGAALAVGALVSSSANGAAIVAASGTSVSGVVTVAAAVGGLATIVGIAFGYRVP